MNSGGNKPNPQSISKKRPAPPIDRQPINREGKPPQAKKPPNVKTAKRRAVKPQQSQSTAKPKKKTDLSDNLRSQTPLRRQMRRQNSPNEPGTVRKTSTQYFRISESGKKNKKTAKKRNKSSSFAKSVTILGFVGYLVLLPITILIASLLLNSGVTVSNDDFRIQLGEGKNIVSKKMYSFDRIYRNDIYYIDMDAVAQYCDLTITGDGKHMRYVVRETEESVEFVLGESVAYINGVAERTGGNSFVSDGKVYIPLEFAKRCFLNLDITIDTKLSRITIVRKTDDKANYLPLDFPYKLTDASDKIIFGELDVDIQEQIIKQNQPTDTAGNN